MPFYMRDFIIYGFGYMRASWQDYFLNQSFIDTKWWFYMYTQTHTHSLHVYSMFTYTCKFITALMWCIWEVVLIAVSLVGVLQNVVCWGTVWWDGSFCALSLDQAWDLIVDVLLLSVTTVMMSVPFANNSFPPRCRSFCSASQRPCTCSFSGMVCSPIYFNIKIV